MQRVEREREGERESACVREGVIISEKEEYIYIKQNKTHTQIFMIYR